MDKQTIQRFSEIKDRINNVSKHINEASQNNINNVAISVTDLEISQIEQAQQITDHDIAIIELQQKEG